MGVASRPQRAWLVCAFVFATVTAMMLVPTSQGGGRPSVPHLDKLVHVAMWFIVALGTWPVVRIARWTSRLSDVRRWLVVVGIATLFGVVIELVQGLTAHRSADVWDAVADCVGAVLGASFGIWRERSRRRRVQSPATLS